MTAYEAKETHENDKILSEKILGAQYFYSLVRNPERKRRNCLKCQEVFISVGSGNRMCARCKDINKAQSDRLLYVAPGRVIRNSKKYDI